MNEIQEHYTRRALGFIKGKEDDWTNRVKSGVPDSYGHYREYVGYLRALKDVQEFIIEDQKPKEDKR